MLSPARPRRARRCTRRRRRHQWIDRRAGHTAAGRLPGADAVHAPGRGRRRHRRVGGVSASPWRGGRRRTSRSPGSTRWPRVPGAGRYAASRTTSTPAPAGWREVLRAPRRPGGGASPGAGGAAGAWALEALRVAAGVRGSAWRPTTGRSRTRSDWLRDRGPPAEGLLPRPGDGGPGAQPRGVRRVGSCCCTSTARAASCPSRRRGVGPRRASAGYQRGRHHELGPVALALVSARPPSTPRSTPPAWPPRRRSWSRPERRLLAGVMHRTPEWA